MCALLTVQIYTLFRFQLFKLSGEVGGHYIFQKTTSQFATLVNALISFGKSFLR